MVMKNKMIAVLSLLLGLMVLAAPLGGEVAGAAKPPKGDKPEKTDGRMAELKERFAQRYPRLKEFKRQGVIGETFEGYVDFVKAKKGEAAAIVEQENADRKELYELIAEKE